MSYAPHERSVLVVVVEHPHGVHVGTGTQALQLQRELRDDLDLAEAVRTRARE